MSVSVPKRYGRFSLLETLWSHLFWKFVTSPGLKGEYQIKFLTSFTALFSYRWNAAFMLQFSVRFDECYVLYHPPLPFQSILQIAATVILTKHRCRNARDTCLLKPLNAFPLCLGKGQNIFTVHKMYYSQNLLWSDTYLHPLVLPNSLHLSSLSASSPCSLPPRPRVCTHFLSSPSS